MARESAAEVLSAKVAAAYTAATKSTAHVTSAAHVASTTAHVTSTTTVTATTTTTCQYVSRNGGASQRHCSDNNCDFVQHQHFHWIAFLFDPDVADCCYRAGTRRASCYQQHLVIALACACPILRALACTCGDQRLPPIFAIA
jgi:hypothetical protein